MKDQDVIELKKIGKHIQLLRLENNLTQKDLAFLLDVEISQITRIERGVVNTSILNIMKIAKALNISLQEFFKELDDRG